MGSAPLNNCSTVIPFAYPPTPPPSVSGSFTVASSMTSCVYIYHVSIISRCTPWQTGFDCIITYCDGPKHIFSTQPCRSRTSLWSSARPGTVSADETSLWQSVGTQRREGVEEMILNTVESYGLGVERYLCFGQVVLGKRTTLSTTLERMSSLKVQWRERMLIGSSVYCPEPSAWCAIHRFLY